MIVRSGMKGIRSSVNPPVALGRTFGAPLKLRVSVPTAAQAAFAKAPVSRPMLSPSARVNWDAATTAVPSLPQKSSALHQYCFNKPLKWR